MSPNRGDAISKALVIAIGAFFLVVVAGMIFIWQYMDFKTKKAFDIRAVARAAPQQVDFVQKALVAPNVLDPDHCFVSQAEYYRREGREAWFFGARLRDDAPQKQSGAAASSGWFLCLLLGPKDAPAEIQAFGEQASSYHGGEPMYSKSEHPGFKFSMQYGSENVSRFLKWEFDYPDRRPKGLFWKMAGLGPGVAGP
jgi:hypothetical protein